MHGLDGKVALVTGGGKGIGRSISLALAARGVRVVVTGRDEKALGETVGEIAYGGGKARHLCGDVRDASHLERAVDRAFEVFGGLDIVIANAGVSGAVLLGADDLARADAILTTNLVGAYCTLHVAAARMKGPGRVIATGRALGAGSAGAVASSASTAGLCSLVRAAASELGPRKITCNAILLGAGTEPERDRAAAAAADLVVYLCSAAADAISGQAIRVGHEG
jgi:NAD(P)-dependent dehydrogenase (short-subunit alcohol dehydrogenase family)